MALRDLVIGGGACAVPGASSSANPLGGLAETLFGSASKTQERLQELPALPGLEEPPTSELQASQSLPGREYDRQLAEPAHQMTGFLRGIHGPDFNGYQDAWKESGAQIPLQPQFQENFSEVFSDFERIYNQGTSAFHPPMGAPSHQVLSGFLRSFFDNREAQVPFHPAAPPHLGLSQGDKLRIRNRGSVMAHHVFADKGQEYADAQLNALLHSLDIEPDSKMWAPQHGGHSELEQYWNEVQIAGMQNGRFVDNADHWATEFMQRRENVQGPQHWVEEFQLHQGDDGTRQFREQKSNAYTKNLGTNQEVEQHMTREQSRIMAETLSQNPDPKFQNSKFLQFVSKMSRGDLILEENQVKPKEESWANEFAKTNQSEKWAAEFTAGEHTHLGNNWLEEFSLTGKQAAQNNDWVDEFANLRMHEWAEEFENEFSGSRDNVEGSWLDSYGKFVEEQPRVDETLPSSSKWPYVFADQNPYMGHTNPLKEGQELFRRGLLSEAVLALEAEVIKNPDNCEGWRLLGITHAENDDDKQSIASMIRARDAEPTNSEVLLSLGVSHTNELDQREALKYLRAWLRHHPKYGGLIPGDQVAGLNHAEVTHLFHEAARMAPNDADVHTVLGVLYNLSREYDRAVESFRTALQLKPRDYSLWNKLGATLANSAQSAEALYAYQEALDLKPNYVRAWSNMGISYANQGRYEDSVRYYVRALCMNPKAENAWQYLRVSLSISGRGNLLDACDRQDLDLLQQKYPL